MLIGDAISEIQKIGERAELPFLETMMMIKANPENYTLAQLRAFYTVMDEGSKMFAPAE